MFRTVSVSIMRILVLYTQQQVYVIQVMFAACQRDPASKQQATGRQTKENKEDSFKKYYNIMRVKKNYVKVQTL